MLSTKIAWSTASGFSFFCLLLSPFQKIGLFGYPQRLDALWGLCYYRFYLFERFEEKSHAPPKICFAGLWAFFASRHVPFGLPIATFPGTPDDAHLTADQFVRFPLPNIG